MFVNIYNFFFFNFYYFFFNFYYYFFLLTFIKYFFLIKRRNSHHSQWRVYKRHVNGFFVSPNWRECHRRQGNHTANLASDLFAQGFFFPTLAKLCTLDYKKRGLEYLKIKTFLNPFEILTGYKSVSFRLRRTDCRGKDTT